MPKKHYPTVHGVPKKKKRARSARKRTRTSKRRKKKKAAPARAPARRGRARRRAHHAGAYRAARMPETMGDFSKSQLGPLQKRPPQHQGYPPHRIQDRGGPHIGYDPWNLQRLRQAVEYQHSAEIWSKRLREVQQRFAQQVPEAEEPEQEPDPLESPPHW